MYILYIYIHWSNLNGHRSKIENTLWVLHKILKSLLGESPLPQFEFWWGWHPFLWLWLTQRIAKVNKLNSIILSVSFHYFLSLTHSYTGISSTSLSWSFVRISFMRFEMRAPNNESFILFWFHSNQTAGCCNNNNNNKCCRNCEKRWQKIRKQCHPPQNDENA